jgi:multiple sugar transport system permease protein
MQGIAGHPQGTTRTMMLYTFIQGFRQGKIGYASAVTVIFFLIVLAASMLQRIFLHEEREVT